MPKLEGELVIGCYVRMKDLDHPRVRDGDVFGRIVYIKDNEVVAVVPEDLNHGYAVVCTKTQVEMWTKDAIPIGQLSFLG